MDGDEEPRRRRRDRWAAFDRLFLVLLSILAAIIVVPVVLTVGVAAISNPVVLGVLLVILWTRSTRRARRARDARRHRLRVEEAAGDPMLDADEEITRTQAD